VLDGRGTLAGWEMRFEGDVGPFRAKLLEHASR
jgi:hypothetical protein